MRSPFPGMNPYLEHHTLWHEVHTRLIVALADNLIPFVSPRYYVAVEQRSYVALIMADGFTGSPDLNIVEEAPFPVLPSTASQGVTATPVIVQMPVQVEQVWRFLEVREIQTQALITTIELLSYSNKQAGKGR